VHVLTIEEIARRAGVSAQTVYAIFKSKTGILIALLDQSLYSLPASAIPN